MPSRRLPNTVPAVIRLLLTARDKRLATPAAADRAISDAQFAQLDPAIPTSLLNRILKEATDVDLALAAQAPLTTALNQTGARCTMFASHFHQVLDLGITRGEFAAGARAYYGRGIHDTTLPDLSTYAAVQTAIDAIVRGEANRFKEEGPAYIAMSHPTAAECAGLLSIFRSQLLASEQSRQNTDTQREELQALYPEAQALAVDLCDTVEFFYRHDLNPGSRRTKCRRWGVIYLYEPTEPRDEGDTTGPGTGGVAPTPTPTPPV